MKSNTGSDRIDLRDESIAESTDATSITDVTDVPNARDILGQNSCMDAIHRRSGPGLNGRCTDVGEGNQIDGHIANDRTRGERSDGRATVQSISHPIGIRCGWTKIGQKNRVQNTGIDVGPVALEWCLAPPRTCPKPAEYRFCR